MAHGSRRSVDGCRETQQETDVLGWSRKMKGRKLVLPKASRNRLCVSEWLAQNTVNAISQRTQPKQVAKSILPSMPPPQNQQTKSAPRSVVLPDEEAATPYDSLGSNPSTAAYTPSAPSRPLSQELSRRRRMHPRLRWPRLAASEDPHTASREGLSTNASEASLGLGETCPGNVTSTGIIIGYDELLEEREEESEFEDFLREEMDEFAGGIVIGEHRIEFEDMDGKFAWPWDNIKNRNSRLSSRSSLPRKTIIQNPLHVESRMSLFTSSTDFSEAGGLSRSSSTLLPRVQEYEGVVAGTTATLHSSESQQLIESRLSSAQSSHDSLNQRKGMLRTLQCTTMKDLQDDKWYLRQAPISSVIARTLAVDAASKSGRSSARSDAKSQEAEKKSGEKASANKAFNFENWGVNDTYICALCNATSKADFARVRRLNLSDNRLTQESVKALTAVADSLSALKICNLAGNQLGEQGGLAAAKFLSTSRPKLMELDLSGNFMGDNACVELCEGLSHFNRGLKVLGLAGNELGHSDAAGAALGQLVQELVELCTLDLHWNSLHGNGGYAFFGGLYENNTTLGGQLRRLNLSWNRLGLRCKDREPHAGVSSGTAHCSCPVCAATSRTAKILSSIFHEGQVLFHLDLSYNGFCASMCAILADGLRDNHTLFGIHLVGNEASVDDQGFIIPSSSLSGISEREQLDHMTNAYVRNVPSCLRRKFAVIRNMPSGASVGLPGGGLDITSWGSLSRNTQKCWICENWIEHTVSYIIGFSGPEKSVDEVIGVSAYFSIDGWTIPTILTHTEEIFQRRLFEGKVATRHLHRTKAAARMSFSHTASLKECIPKTESGKIVRWVGSRVLPPSAEPIEVVFHVLRAVNEGTGKDKVVAAFDLPTRQLQIPKLIATGRPDKVVPEKPSVELRRSSTVGQTAPGKAESPAALEVHEVNVLNVALSSLERFEQGTAVALCVLEDPARRGDVAVFPRRAANQPAPKPVERWTFESSSFKDFNRDNDKTIVQCFENDWKLSKLEQVIKSDRDQEKMCTYLSQRYKQVMVAYHYAAFSTFVDPNYSVFIGMNGVKELMIRYDKKPGGQALNRARTGWLFDGKALTTSDVDNIYVAANVFCVEGDDLKKYKALPARGLARFQFLEAFVRIVLTRFYDSQEKEDPALAMQEFLKVSQFGEDILELRKSLHMSLFTEECCLVFKENKSMLEALYDSYKRRACYPGRPLKGITYGSWLEMMNEAEANEGGLTSRDFGIAFALGKEVRVDEIITFRHMELTWPEFLVALGAVVRLRSDFEADFFADMLSDFIVDHLTEVHHKDLSSSGKQRNLDQDPTLAPIMALVARLFEDADEDNSGSLSVREFKRCMMQPQVKEEVRNLGIEVGEFNVLFRSLDADRSGEVTLDEFCQGFIKMKMAMRGLSRAIAYFRRVIEEKDADGSGSLNLSEFQSLCQDPNILKKMQALGIEIDEIETLFEEIVADNVSNGESDPASIHDSEVEADHVIAAFIRMRDPSLGGKRAINFLRQVFIEADADQSGSLTRAEVKATFINERVTLKIQKLGLKVPDWLGIFDALDINFDGELSWEELHQGVQTLWEADLEQQVKSAAARKSEAFSINISKQQRKTNAMR